MYNTAQVNFKVLGGMVDVEFSHHKQIIEKKSVSEDRDWSCFKVIIYTACSAMMSVQSVQTVKSMVSVIHTMYTCTCRWWHFVHLCVAMCVVVLMWWSHSVRSCSTSSSHHPCSHNMYCMLCEESPRDGNTVHVHVHTCKLCVHAYFSLFWNCVYIECVLVLILPIVHVSILFQCGTLNFARRRMCMTCDCSRGGKSHINPHSQLSTCHCVVSHAAESESLHADVREGRLSSNSEERRFDSEPEGRNPPSNG